MIPSESISMATRGGLATTTLTFSLGTTFLLHWFSKPYVLRMLVHPPVGIKTPDNNPEVTIEYLNIFSGISQTKHSLNDLRPFSDMLHPFINFRNKNLDQKFYVHQDLATHRLFDAIFHTDGNNA